MGDELDRVAGEMWSTARDAEQCVRRIPSDAEASLVRAAVRRLAAADGIKVRTARMSDTVVVVRADARVWSEDTATMRRKLTPQR